MSIFNTVTHLNTRLLKYSAL